MVASIWQPAKIAILDPPVAPPQASAELVLESVDATGLIQGWARACGRIVAVGVEIWLEGVLAGFAKAMHFRRDLFAAGLGHAHYGFECRLKPGTRLGGTMELRDAASGHVLASRSLVFGNAVTPDMAQPIETMLAGLRSWNAADCERGCGALELERNRALLGDRLFIGQLYHFLLGRWPDAQEWQRDRNALELRQMSPADLARRLAATGEGRLCRSPYDPSFPFRLTPHDPALREQGPILERRAAPRRARPMDYLASARLVSPPWDSQYAQFSYQAQQGILLCHPPASGITLLHLQQFTEPGPLQLRMRASIGNAQSHAVEFAVVLAGMHCHDHEILMRLANNREEAPWHRIGWGASRMLHAGFEQADQPAKLYLATRMAADAPNNYFAWAHFSNLHWSRPAAGIQDSIHRAWH